VSKIFKIIVEETIRIIPAIIFFLIFFNLIAFTENLMVKQREAGYFSYGFATFGALIVGKFILIVNNLPFINLFPNRPLIYNISWKFFIYGLLALLFRIVERSVELIYHYENTHIVYSHLKKILDAPIFWAIQIWVLMLFIAYIVCCEFIRVLGKEEVTFILFKKRP
jgi:hypothetical protein